MKKILLCLFVTLSPRLFLFSQSIGIGTTSPHPSAQLDITSNSKGLLIPRMTQAERDVITPALGLMIYNTGTNSFQYYNGSGWSNITHSGLVTGITNKIPKFTGPWGLGNSMMTDNGAGVSINSNNAAADGSALLDMSSTSRGVLVPRMTTAERTAITAPAKGLLVFDNTTSTFWYHNGSVWDELGNGGSSGNWNSNGSAIYNGNAGNVGVGTADPVDKLSVTGSVVIDQNNTNSGSFANLLRFGSGPFATGIGSNRLSGVSQYGLDFYTKGSARLRIDTNGNTAVGGSPLAAYKFYVNGDTYTSGEGIVSGGLGVATTSPDLISYKLDVNGNSRTRQDAYVNRDTWIDRNLDVDGTSNLFGTITAGNDINVGDNVNVGNNLTVSNGKGIIRSSNSDQLKYYTREAAFTAILGAHGTSGEGAIGFASAGFTSPPAVMVGDIVSTGGTVGQLYRVQLVIYDVTTTSCKCRLINTSSAPVNYDVTWNIICIGK